MYDASEETKTIRWDCFDAKGGQHVQGKKKPSPYAAMDCPGDSVYDTNSLPEILMAVSDSDLRF